MDRIEDFRSFRCRMVRAFCVQGNHERVAIELRKDGPHVMTADDLGLGASASLPNPQETA